jgi:hypothetical protein
MPFKYLGLPLGVHFKVKSIWNNIVEKIECQLASWKRMHCPREVGLPSLKALFPTYPRTSCPFFPSML